MGRENEKKMKQIWMSMAGYFDKGKKGLGHEVPTDWFLEELHP